MPGDGCWLRNQRFARFGLNRSVLLPVRVSFSGWIDGLLPAMGTQPAPDGIAVYVISLKDCETRLRNMSERLDALGIPFRFVDAIDGRTQRVPDQFDGARVDRHGFRFESGIACTLSHRLVQRMIADGAADLGLIFEDDAALSPDFREALQDCAALMRAQPKIDIIKLEGTPASPEIHVTRVGSRSLVLGRTPSGGAAAYLLRRTAAIRFCSLSVIDMMTDLVFGDPRLGFRVFELQPYPAHQDRLTPELCGFQSLGHRPFHFSTGHQPWLSRLAASIEKRTRFARLHGLGPAFRMEIATIGVKSKVPSRG
jgi:GR25 family glycosyltransferase involved in LPS biosynthesis